MGLLFSSKKTVNETNQYDQSTNTDSSQDFSVTGGGLLSTTLGQGATQNNYSLDAEVSSNALRLAGGAIANQGNVAVGAMNTAGTAAANALGAGAQYMATGATVAGMGLLVADNAVDSNTALATAVVNAAHAGDQAIADTAQQGLLTAQSLGNNAQNLGMSAFSAATNMAGNAFGTASYLGAQNTALNLAMSRTMADLAGGLGEGAFNLADSVVGNNAALTAAAFDNSQAIVRQVTDLADSSQSRMADLVTQTQDYNTDLAKTAATGGASDLMKTLLWLGVAGAAAFVLRR